MMHYGIYRGTVVDNRDPQNHRRLKVTVPQIFGEQKTEWIWPREDANMKLGMPSVGQGVWVMFEGGDAHFPVWVGTFGKHSASEHHGLVRAVKSVSGTSPHLKLVQNSDGTTDVDVLATLVAMAQKIIELEQRVVTLENKPDPDA